MHSGCTRRKFCLLSSGPEAARRSTRGAARCEETGDTRHGPSIAGPRPMHVGVSRGGRSRARRQARPGSSPTGCLRVVSVPMLALWRKFAGPQLWTISAGKCAGPEFADKARQSGHEQTVRVRVKRPGRTARRPVARRQTKAGHIRAAERACASGCERWSRLSIAWLRTRQRFRAGNRTGATPRAH